MVVSSTRCKDKLFINRKFVLNCLLIENICFSVVGVCKNMRFEFFIYVTFGLAPVIVNSNPDESAVGHKRRHSKINRAPDDICKDSEESTICNRPEGGLCRNKTCVSACAIRSLQKCNCPQEDDNYCYLCCGGAHSSCRPAHEYQIFQPNGEWWERDTCNRCKNSMNGLSCDDRDSRRVCYNGRCVATICNGQLEGSFCDTRREKICTDGQCRNPCKEYRSTFITCDCDVFSEDRCQLCCYDPHTKRCDNAFRKYGIKNKDKRPIYRHGINCKRGFTCSKIGTCSGATTSVSFITVCLVVASQFVYSLYDSYIFVRLAQ